LISSELPCDQCITKAICLTKDELNCFPLASYLKIHLEEYRIPSLKGYASKYYVVNQIDISLVINWSDWITIGSLTAKRRCLKHVYKFIKENNEENTDY
jgi:hypothetical protein